MLAAAMRSLMIDDTVSQERRSEVTRPCGSTGRKTRLHSIPASASQPSRARTGQCRVRPKGMPILRPAPSWSVFERMSVSMSLPHASFAVSGAAMALIA
jgi:hypothetical protein